MKCLVVTWDPSQLDISPLKAVALLNMENLAVTRGTFQLDISALKAMAQNMLCMAVTRDTFQLGTLSPFASADGRTEADGVRSKG